MGILEVKNWNEKFNNLNSRTDTKEEEINECKNKSNIN